MAQDKDAMQQVPVRLHVNDYKAMRKLMLDDGWNFQKFVRACVDAYLKRDPLLIKVVEDWKAEQDVPKRLRDKGVTSLSKREADSIFDELEEDK